MENTSFLDIIKMRKSTRRFIIENLDIEFINKILSETKDFIQLSGYKVKFIPVLKNKELEKSFKTAFGDFGKLLNAPLYAGIATDKNYENCLTNIGFIGEQMILKLTEAGFSTCWHATRNLQVFRKPFNITDDEIMPSLISIGHAATDFQSKLINKMMGKTSGKRKKLKDIIFKENGKNKTDKKFLTEIGLLEVFEGARLAPSWHNVQPWHFILKDNTVFLIISLDEKRYKARAVEEKMHYHMIDMGIIMSHLSIGLKENNKNFDWNIINKKDISSVRKELAMKDEQGIPFAYIKPEKF